MATAQALTVKNLNVHIGILTQPVSLTVADMMQNMNTLFSEANIVVTHTTQNPRQLGLTQDDLEFLNELDVGECAGIPSQEQLDLSRLRGNLPAADVLVFICDTVLGTFGGNPGIFDGCSLHISGAPMAVVRKLASPYSLAHEIGHLLGLSHTNVRFRRRLMNPRPQLILPDVHLKPSEITKMRNSPLLSPMPS